MEYNLSFTLLHISTILVLITSGLVLKMRNKTQMHFIFLSYMFFMVLWDFGLILDAYAGSVFGYKGSIFFYITHIGLIFVPVTILYTGIIYAQTKITFSWKHVLLLIIPVISVIVLLTNEHHNLFYIKYSILSSNVVAGKYFLIHAIYSYSCILLGLSCLVYFSIKNSGFFSKQSILIFIGSIVPVVVNILITFKLLESTAFLTPISFAFTVLFYMLAIFKFNFLNITPIALQKVVDLISDSFVVINEELNIVDYNKTFIETFKPLYSIKRNVNILDMLNSNPSISADINDLHDYIGKARKDNISVTFEKNLKAEGFDKYFSIEVTPILSRENYLGTILLLKDITQSKKDLEIIKENQMILMEQERLASLGQLIAGIAHNLMTPIMSISGNIEALKDLANEYEESIGDKEVTCEDHREIAVEMKQLLDKMKPYCTYMSDIITTVKGQALQASSSLTESFTLDELVKRIDLLMAHELKKCHCTLKTNFQVDASLTIKGELNSLVQVLDNIIINAIHAYEGQNGDIDFAIKKVDNNIVFMLRDYGKGIQNDIKSRLFKEMVTTKGKNGTGLGLYMSYANIKARFSGNIWFDTQEGIGTTFYISIPYQKNIACQEVAG